MQSDIIIRLPFRMVVEDGGSFVSSFGEYDFKIVFEQRDLIVSGEQWDEEALPITVVVITTNSDVHSQVEHPLPADIVKDFFLNSLAYLNRIIDAYRIIHQDYTVRNIALTDLPVALTISIDDHAYLYWINVPEWSVEKSDTEMHEHMLGILEMLEKWSAWPDMFNVQRFYVSARNYMEQGNYSSAVIELETTFEMHMRLTFLLILDHIKMKDEKRAGLLKMPFRNLIEDHFAKHLGGSFSYTDPGPIHDWFTDLYTLRNTCVHEGKYHVSGDEVIAAFKAFHAAEDYVAQKLITLGILDKAGLLYFEKYVPRRLIETHREESKVRLIAAGLLPDDVNLFVKVKQNPESNGQRYVEVDRSAGNLAEDPDAGNT